MAEGLETRLTAAGLHVVLVRQGGGALGAYQTGIYHALHEHKLPRPSSAPLRIDDELYWK